LNKIPQKFYKRFFFLHLIYQYVCNNNWMVWIKNFSARRKKTDRELSRFLVSGLLQSKL